MKVVILAGGFGTRISEESYNKPKPMVEIGGKPIIWHIMKLFQTQGFNEFIICGGYKKEVLFDYFEDCNEFNVQVVDTGLDTLTGGRIKRLENIIGNNSFILTYGDGLSDVNINDVIAFHKINKRIATITSVQIEQRFGIVTLDKSGLVTFFGEKLEKDGPIINGGFMVLEPQIFKYIKGDEVSLEKDSLVKLCKEKQLDSYMHKGFWVCMDTLRDKNKLEELWKSGNAPWKIWKN